MIHNSMVWIVIENNVPLCAFATRERAIRYIDNCQHDSYNKNQLRAMAIYLHDE